jgi:hypothetical protein
MHMIVVLHVARYNHPQNCVGISWNCIETNCLNTYSVKALLGTASTVDSTIASGGKA